jgi:hypothetical protein
VHWPCDVSTESPTVTAGAVAFASDVLWALSGRQFGLTTVTLRPCKNYPLDTPYPDAWMSWPGTQRPPLYANGSGGWYGSYWMAAGCGQCGVPQSCGCGTIQQVELPAPVNSIVTVKIDGSPIVSGAYRVDDNRFLVRTDGGVWPNANDLSKNDDQLGTWSVTATYGLNLPAGADWAVGELACELIKAQNGEDCRLPRHLTQLVRQGVTISLPDLSQLFKDGQTGLYLADIFINTWNPGHLRARARTYRVDQQLTRRAGT